MTFLEKLDYLMAKQGLNKNKLSIKSDVPYTTIDGFYKKGFENTKLQTIKKLALALNVSVDYLILDEITDENYGERPTRDATALTLAETRHIDQYRALDAHGKEMADIVIEKETARIEAEKLVPKDPWKENDRIVKMRVYDLSAAAGVGNYLYDYGENEYEEIEYKMRDIPEGADFGVRIQGDSMEPRIFDGDIAWVKQQHEIESGEIGIFVINGEAYCKMLEFIHGGGGVYLVSLNEKYDSIRIEYDMDARAIGVVVGTSKGRRQSWR